MEEEWGQIDSAPGYLISTYGEVYSTVRSQIVSQSHTMQGDLKVNLNIRGRRIVRSVRSLMAETFLTPLNSRCNTVIVLDGNQDNVHLDNLELRPRWFAWRYCAQLRVEQPEHYHNLPVMDLETGECFNSIVDAGITEGLLFEDIWRSYQERVKIFPMNGPFVRCEGV